MIILLFKGVLTATYIEILKEFNEELIKERSAPVIGSNRIIQSHNTHLIVLKKLRDKYITNLEKITNRKTIIYYSGFLKLNPVSSSFGMSSQSRTNDMHISINDQDINAFSSNIFSKISKSTLSTNGYDIVLHTPGGAATSCEQLIQTITAFCDNNFRTIIPQQAMSAGTMIACASKEIIMDDSAALGPTDPQVWGGLPAQAIVDEVDSIINEVKKDQVKILVYREILAKYPPTFIGQSKEAIALVDELLKKYLKRNMLAKKSESDVQEIIQNFLSSHKFSKLHGRPYSPDVCLEHGLNVVKTSSDANLKQAIESLHNICLLSIEILNISKLIDSVDCDAWIISSNQLLV